MAEEEPSPSDDSSDDEVHPVRFMTASVVNIDPSILSNFKKLQDEPQDIKDAYIRQITKACTSELVEFVDGVDATIEYDDEEIPYDDRRVFEACAVANTIRMMLRERGIAFSDVGTNGGTPREPILICATLVQSVVHDHRGRFRTLTGSVLSKEACWKLVSAIVSDVFAVDAVLQSTYVANEEDAPEEQDEEESEGEGESSEEESSESEDSTDEEEDSATSEESEEEEPEAKRSRRHEMEISFKPI